MLMNTPSTGVSYYITVNEGGTFAVKDSTVYLANGKAHIDINNATATFDGSTISMGMSNASSIGSAATAERCSSQAPHRP